MGVFVQRSHSLLSFTRPPTIVPLLRTEQVTIPVSLVFILAIEQPSWMDWIILFIIEGFCLQKNPSQLLKETSLLLAVYPAGVRQLVSVRKSLIALYTTNLRRCFHKTVTTVATCLVEPIRP